MLRSLRCCLDPKAIGALAAIGLTLWLLAPGRGSAAIPLLITLVCPLSMGVMAWRMRSGHAVTARSAEIQSLARQGDVDAELRALHEDLAIVRARRRLASYDDGSSS